MAEKRARAGCTASGAVRRVSLDACEIHRHPRLTRVGRRRGPTRRVPAAGADARVTVDGALDSASGRRTWQTAAQTPSATFVAFLDRLAAAVPEGQVLGVLDTVGAHSATRRAAGGWRPATGSARAGCPRAPRS